MARGKAYHQLFSLLKSPQERCQGTNIHGVGQDGHEVVEDTCNLAEQGSNPLRSLRDFNVQELLDGEGEALLVGHHRNVIQSVKVGQSL
jgi:hypothetical protein